MAQQPVGPDLGAEVEAVLPRQAHLRDDQPGASRERQAQRLVGVGGLEDRHVVAVQGLSQEPPARASGSTTSALRRAFGSDSKMLASFGGAAGCRAPAASAGRQGHGGAGRERGLRAAPQPLERRVGVLQAVDHALGARPARDVSDDAEARRRRGVAVRLDVLQDHHGVVRRLGVDVEGPQHGVPLVEERGRKRALQVVTAAGPARDRSEDRLARVGQDQVGCADADQVLGSLGIRRSDDPEVLVAKEPFHLRTGEGIGLEHQDAADARRRTAVRGTAAVGTGTPGHAGDRRPPSVCQCLFGHDPPLGAAENHRRGGRT